MKELAAMFAKWSFLGREGGGRLGLPPFQAVKGGIDYVSSL